MNHPSIMVIMESLPNRTECPECGDGIIIMWTGKNNRYRCIDSVTKVTGCKWEYPSQTGV